ncbi:uncharacterized protein [Macrobrachium rosenbergii]|uniref:uncharacterized protein n=1 Tax=Macrobrachium rosenbergii TaxID=79674 RepID=UPI0034D55893
MNSYDMVDNIQLTPLKRGKFTYMDSYEALEYGGDDVLIKLTRAVEISVQCNFQFTTFPFDLQLCLIPVVLSGLGYPEVDKQQLKVFSDPQHLSIYNVDPIRCRTQLLNDSIVRDTVVIAVMIRRRSEGFFLTTLGPCLVLEILGHISLVAFPVDEFYQRASTALSLLIVMASLFSQSVTILPKSASPKAVDVWFFFFTLRFFLFFVAHCMVELHRTRVASSSKKEDRNSKRQLDSQEGKSKVRVLKNLHSHKEYLGQSLAMRIRHGAENSKNVHSFNVENPWMLKSASNKTFISPATVNLWCLAIGIAIDFIFVGLFVYSIKLLNYKHIDEFMKYNDCS